MGIITPWWEIRDGESLRLTGLIPAGNKAKRFLWVNHTTKIIHPHHRHHQHHYHHYHHHHHQIFYIKMIKIREIPYNLGVNQTILSF